MSAIITSEFRLNTTSVFVDALGTDSYYMGLGRPNNWTDELNPDVPYENVYTTNTVWENMYAMKKLDSTDITYTCPRNVWVSGQTYSEYDDRDSNLEGKQYYVISDNNNVYLCLKSGGVSTKDPDIEGVTTSGVIDYTNADGYIWKYLFTVPVDTGTKFLTASFIPVVHLDTQPTPGSDTALLNQWAVQQNTVDGAIYNVKIDNAGTGYTSAPTVTIEGDGTNATATATVSGGVITDIEVTNIGSGYTKAIVTLSGGGGSNGSVRAVIGPKGGFGADPRVDLRTHYVIINKVFNGNEAGTIPSANDFRQITLVKNPLEDGGSPAAANAYTVAHSLEVSLGSTFDPDDVIEGTVTGAKGFVVEYDSVNGIIKYVQNEDTGYTPFTTSDLIRLETASTGGETCTAVVDPEVQHYSGDVVFVENRTAVTRASDQIETIRLVIEF